MILIEGPDNSGKSTLIKKLVDRFGLIPCERPHGVPKTVDELIERTLFSEGYYNNRLSIMDRNPVIGENIYGPILRNKNLWDYADKDTQINMEANLFGKIITKTIFLVYCRPPLEVVTNLDTHQVKDYDTEEHLKSLSLNRYRIVKAYDDVMSSWAHYKYDYKQPGSLEELFDKIEKEYMSNERKRYLTRFNTNTNER